MAFPALANFAVRLLGPEAATAIGQAFVYDTTQYALTGVITGASYGAYAFGRAFGHPRMEEVLPVGFGAVMVGGSIGYFTGPYWTVIAAGLHLGMYVAQKAAQK